MWIKRQEGYCLKEIAGVHYLLPYGQKVADQRKGIVLNETGVFLWNELKTSMTDDALAEKLVHYYSADGEAANETQDEIQDQTKDKIQNQMQDQIQDQIRQDVKQFVQELLSLAILQECLRPCCAEDANDATCVYPTKEPFVECLEIAGMRIALYGSRELISSQFDAFLKDCSSAQGKSKSELQTESQIKMQIKMPVQMQIEILQRTTSFHPNGKTLIRNEELVVCENEQGYIILFPSMNQIREAHMTSDGRFAQIYVNTIIITVLTVLFQVAFCTMAAYGFARIEFPFKNAIFIVLLAILMVPGQIFLIPQYLIIQNLGLVNTLPGLFLPNLFSAFGTFLLRQFFMSLPKELEEAALLDGCNRFQIFGKIMLPLVKPGIVALVIFTARFAWNDFMWPLIVNTDSQKMTLAPALSLLKGQYLTNYPVQMAGAVMAVLPLVIVFIIFQRQFIEGVAQSGIKG